MAATNYRAILEQRSAYSLRPLRREYVQRHSNAIESLLHREDARASRLDMRAYTDFIEELSTHWLDDTAIGCCVVRKQDAEEVPVAIVGRWL